MSEQAVLVQFRCGSENRSQLEELELDLEEVIDENGVGVFDGSDLLTGQRHGYLYMYGPDADTLFHVVRPVLESAEFLEEAVARLRYGPPGWHRAPARQVKLTPRSNVP